MNREIIRDRFYLPGILLMMMVVVLSSLYGLKNILETSADLANEFLIRTSNATRIEVESFLHPALHANMFFEDYLTVEPEAFQDYDQLEALGKQVLKRYPSLRSFNVGYEDGNFFMVKRNGDDTFSIKKVYRNLEAPYVTWQHYDRNDQPTDFLIEAFDGFDPRTRNWYQGAIDKGSLYWTPLYTHFTDQDMGITVGMPFEGLEGIKGVFSFDFKLEGIVNYISALEISENGEAIIVNYRENLLAFTTAESLDLEKNMIRPTQISGIGDLVIQEAYTLSQEGVGRVSRFTVSGERYYVMFSDLSAINNDYWKIGIVIPEKDFLKGYLVTRSITIAVIIIVLILVVTLNYYRYSERRVKNYLVKYSEQDPLTELRNRRATVQLYDKLINNKQKNYYPVSLLLCDIDHFKSINDRYGHNCGDQALKVLSQLLMSNLREDDIACRWGGEEFLIILRNSDSNQAVQAAEKIRLLVEESSVTCEGHTFGFTLSFGVKTTDENLDLQVLVEEADKCLYKAKQTGRNKVVSQVKES